MGRAGSRDGSGARQDPPRFRIAIFSRAPLPSARGVAAAAAAAPVGPGTPAPAAMTPSQLGEPLARPRGGAPSAPGPCGALTPTVAIAGR